MFNELCIKRFAACANVYEHCHDGYIYERKLSRAEYVASVHCHECHNEVYEYYCRCRASMTAMLPKVSASMERVSDIVSPIPNGSGN